MKSNIMAKEDLVKKYAHCETYCKGSDEYRELDAMTDMQITEGPLTDVLKRNQKIINKRKGN